MINEFFISDNFSIKFSNDKLEEISFDFIRADKNEQIKFYEKIFQAIKFFGISNEIPEIPFCKMETVTLTKLKRNWLLTIYTKDDDIFETTL